MQTAKNTCDFNNSVPRLARFAFAFAALIGSLFWLSACGNGFNEPMRASSEARARLPVEPQEPTYPTLPAKAQPKDKEYGIYNVTDAKVGADLNRNEISARVLVQSTAGDETVELLGRIRKDGSATLIDINPIENNKYRLTAEALCVDRDECKKIIVNIVYKVGTKQIRKQFVTKPLVPERQERQENQDARTLSPVNNGPPSAAPTVTNPPPQPAPPQAPLPVLRPEPKDDHDHDDDGEMEGSDDPDSEINGENQIGEYVGVHPPKEVIEKLWERPLKPKPEDIQTDAPGPISFDPLPPEAEGPFVHEDEDSVPIQPAPGTEPAPAKPIPDSPSVPTTEPIENSEKAPKKQAEKQAEKQDEKPRQQPEAVEEEKPSMKIPIPQRKPSPPPEPSKAKDDKKPIETEEIPLPGRKPQVPPVVATAPEIKQDSVSEQELKIASLMDIIEGGRAIGSYVTTREDGDGKIENADKLSDTGKGYRKLYPQRDRDFGTGMLVSLIENASAYFVGKLYPGAIVVVGDLSQEKGGKLRGSRHKSHQSGLDVDMPYIGTYKFESVVLNGKLKPDFDYAKNWNYFRLIASQQIVLGGVQQTVLNRVFVDQAVKKGFCAWAKKNGIINKPFDAEILRRLRAEPGHKDHFHVRLKCSPYYPLCRNQPDPPPGTGC